LTGRPPLWVADWSDREDADFREAWRRAGVKARVLRSAPLGPTVGTRGHRTRSWPTYGRLALSAVVGARGAPIVAWQPVAGALAAVVRPRGRPPVIALNPLLHARATSWRESAMLGGLRRADRVVFYSRRALEAARGLDLAPERLRFVRLGVQPRCDVSPLPGAYLLAAGRERRDWTTLARAAREIEMEIRVIGPNRLELPPPLRVMPPLSHEGFLRAVGGSMAVIVPLDGPERTVGQLTVLDAMSMGRAVIATRTQGTEDYVSPDVGFLVPPQDACALRDAVTEVARPGVAATMGAAALAATRGPLSLERFVSQIDREVQELAG
jgi:glycosyltransferase involved in cell wall biosynthesis